MIVDFSASLVAWRNCKPLGWKDGARSWGSFPMEFFKFIHFSTPSKAGAESICPLQTGGWTGKLFQSIYQGVHATELVFRDEFIILGCWLLHANTCRSLRWKSSSLLFASGNDVGPSALDESNPVCPCVCVCVCACVRACVGVLARSQYEVDSVGSVSH